MRQQNKQIRRRIELTLAALAITTGLDFAAQAEAVSGSAEGTQSEGVDAPRHVGDRSYQEVDQQQHEDVGGPHRIDHSGRLRMISQRLPAAACILSTSPDSEYMRESLIKARDKFDKILVALRDGDDELEIYGAESDRRILHNLNLVMELWTPFKAAIDDILSGSDVEKNMEFLAANNMALLDASAILVSEISAEYSHPAEMSAAGALLVNLAGRQRMLSQKLAKESCGVITGIDAFGTRDEMMATHTLSDAVLAALMNGQPDAGVLPPPTDEIRGKLEAHLDEWQEVESIITRTTGVGSVDSETEVHLFEVLTQEVIELSVITGLYAVAAKIER